MPEVNKIQSRKVSDMFRVEIRVGLSWVTYKDADTETEARKHAQIALGEKGVKEVKIVEHEVIHKATVIWEDKPIEHLVKIPKQFKDTGKYTNCPACDYHWGHIADDGSMRWVVCGKCGKTVPCPT